jgi:hypothetical protein
VSKSSQPSRADLLIAGDFLDSCRTVRAALRLMERYGQFSERKPERYWHAVLRNVWLDYLSCGREVDEILEAHIATDIPNRSDCDLSLVRESPRPISSILSFLLSTLHLSFIWEMPVLKRALALQKRKKGSGLHHVQKMPVLRSAQRLQILSF